MSAPKLGIAGRLALAFIDSKLTPLMLISALLLGGVAVWLLPREEEPQIIVPMVDVVVSMEGASPREVEARVTRPLERLLYEVAGVEYVYSTSSAGLAMVIVRFAVGEDEQRAMVRLQEKLQANFDLIPPGASPPLVKRRSIDDVPILAITLTSARYSGYELRRLGAELLNDLKDVDGVSEATLIGGERRAVRVLLDPERLAAHALSPLEVAAATAAANLRLPAGYVTIDNQEIVLETGSWLGSGEDVANVVVGVHAGRPVFLRSIARIIDGPEEPASYVRFVRGGEDGKLPRAMPAVTLTIAKHAGENAVAVVDAVHRKLDALRGTLVPNDVELVVTRDYGATANEKSNELLLHMALAVLSVGALIWFALGRRESLIVMLAVPATLALTLTVFYLYGYTLNRITLFALIFSIGILVDDAIVVVENIVRHSRLPENRDKPLAEVAVRAVDEVGNPTILATMTVIAAILPMAVVGGLMGPYMRPIPVGASAAMVFSLLVAFVLTPWAAVRLLRRETHGAHETESRLTLFYRHIMGTLLSNPFWRTVFLAGVVVALVIATALVGIGWVKVKMLPFDNKSEMQVVVDMPEGTPLEGTDRAVQQLVEAIRDDSDVTSMVSYSGVSGPYNFNGLVRHYFARRGANVADIHVMLRDKGERSDQSHVIAKRLRAVLTPIAATLGARIKVAEVPPGPPVLQTMVAEVYGPDYERQIELARKVRDVMESTPGLVDVDWYVEDPQPKRRLLVDREKAALAGLTERQVAQALRIVTSGETIGLAHDAREREDVPIIVQNDRATRSDLNHLLATPMTGTGGTHVSIAELVDVLPAHAEHAIYHKNLMPVVYVTADVAGDIESPVYAMLELSPKIDRLELPGGYRVEQRTASQPFDTESFALKWDGEWHITYEVFRDLGAAFAAVLLLIYVLNVAWFQSFRTPLVIMSAIPFSLVGILPAHGLMHAFFSATSMIGFIAGAGIVVRNSIILVDFIEQRLDEGVPLQQAVVDAGAIRFRPMLLTAAAVVVGAFVILFDPIFQGLAIALMAGEVASLLLSRMTVPIAYFLMRRRVAAKVAASPGNAVVHGIGEEVRHVH